MTLQERLHGIKLFDFGVPPSEAELPMIEKRLGVELGPQLRDYILSFADVAPDPNEDGMELCGIDSEDLEKSSMVLQTDWMRSCVGGLEKYVFLESEAMSCVDVVVDENDGVFLIDWNATEFFDIGVKLIDYLYYRFKYGDWIFMNDEGRATIEMSEEDRKYYQEHYPNS